MRATFLTLGLASALAFATRNTAMAQRHGGGGAHGGGGGGAHGGGGGAHGGGGYHGGGYHGGGYGGVYHGGYGGRYGYARYGYGGYRGYGYGYGPFIGAGLYIGGLGLYGSPGYSYYGSPSYYYSAPDYYQEPPVTYAPPSVPMIAAQPVTLTVQLPRADAQVFLNGAATTSSGAERVFQSPPVDPAKSYQYTVTARWMDNGKSVEQKRDVIVKAGQSVSVDFR